jgi:hypothetical protein
MMVKVGTVLAGAMALALAGCAAAGNHAALIPGLTSGPLPEPKPFVVDSRPPQTQQYPSIGYTPPPRREPPMTQAETDKLDADLQAAAGIRKKRRPVPVKAQ